MKLPKESKDYLSKITQEIPKTPYLGLKGIQEYKNSRFRYGSNENIEQNSWVRYPHEIKQFRSCQEAGIFNYLVAKHLGLETVLLRFENYDLIGQPHLAAMVQGSRHNYLFSNNLIERLQELSNTHMIANKQVIAFSKVEIVDDKQIEDLFMQGKDPSYIRQFFDKGQALSTYYDSVPEAFIHYGLHRFLEIKDDHLLLRKTFDFGNFFLNILFNEDNSEILFSSGVNNRELVNPIHISTIYDESVNKGKYPLWYEAISDDHKERMYKVFTKNNLAARYVDLRINSKIEEISKKNEKTIFVKGRKQRELFSQYWYVNRYVYSLEKNNIDEYLDYEHTPDIHKLLQHRTQLVQKQDSNSYYRNKQRPLLDKLRHLCDAQGIRTTKFKA